ncbi:hypothetical protein GCM10023238_00750 [Streptomyces heliomycini]
MPAIHRYRGEIRRSSPARWARGAAPPRRADGHARRTREAARQHLREKFLRARSRLRANFMVAETGTLVVVESEGNGRMCLTLPETLISVVGIEKIVPTWQDLEVFLQTLPRSSTAERMNPYPRRDRHHRRGRPARLHLVLLDNMAAPTRSPTRWPAGAALHPLARPA